MNIVGEVDNIVSFNSPLWDEGFAEDSTLERFYSAKEAAWSYANTYRVTDRRVLALNVTHALTSFLDNEASLEEITFIRKLIERDVEIAASDKVSNVNRSLANRLRDIDSTGFRLLEINEFVDLTTLKTSYKRAARKYHPDLGGNVADMQALNRAYSAFFDLVNNDAYLETNGAAAAMPSSLTDWLFAMHLVLACIHGDSYAADRAVYHLRKAHEYMRQTDSPFVGQFIGHFAYEGINRPCNVLARFRMETELLVVATLTEEMTDRYIRDWRPAFEGDLKPSRDNLPTARDFLAGLGTAFVITNIDQAKNAFRLGKIDQKRLDYATRRAKEREEKRERMENQIRHFTQTVGFTPLPSTPAANWIVRRQVRIVPAPQWNQDRFVFLSDEQKCEYYQAFGESSELTLLEKYQRVRGNEVLLALIKHYEQANLEQLRMEIDFLLNLDHSFRWYEPLPRVYDYLERLPQASRREKLALLTEMDDIDKPQEIRYLFVLNLSFDADSEPLKQKKRINVGDDYAKFLELDLNEIRTFQSSGYLPTDFHQRP